MATGRRGAARLAILVAVVGLSACDLPTAPLPADAEPFAPPAIYARWWAMTEACAGRSGDLSRVRWYRAPGSAVLLDGRPVAGYWSMRRNNIVLADDYLDDGRVVRHEMLHALLRVGGHPRAEFAAACAAIVDCSGNCPDGPKPSAAAWQGYAVLPPDSLDVASEARLLPAEADGQRWLTLMVTVRNPRDRGVVVAAPGDVVTPPTFGYDLRGPTGGIMGGDVATDSSTLVFAPFETKQRLFEFRVASELTPVRVPPGVHLVRGSYARHFTAYDTIAVTP